MIMINAGGLLAVCTLEAITASPEAMTASRSSKIASQQPAVVLQQVGQAAWLIYRPTKRTHVRYAWEVSLQVCQH